MTNKKNLIHTIFDMPVTRQIKLDCLTTVTRCTPYCDDDTGSVCHAAAIHVVAQRWQFPDKNFIEYLIISSPDVKHVWELKEIISIAYSNVNGLSSTIYIYIIIIIGIQPLGLSGQRPELSQATGMALVRCILGEFLGVVCHCFPPRLDVPTFATRCPHVRHNARSQRRKVELWARIMSGNFTEMTTSMPFRDLLYAANLWHETNGFTSPLKEGVLRIFFTLKNLMASAGFERMNLGTKGQHATPRPPKPQISDEI
jgi:hypothetical protein